MEEEEEGIVVYIEAENAKRLARLLRMVGSQGADFDERLVETLDELAMGIGSYFGICSNSDEPDELDEGLDLGDTIEFSIWDRGYYGDMVTPTEVKATYN